APAGVLDLHSHILPAIDDGVATVEEARELARAAVAEGVTAMAATPHVRWDHPTRVEAMEAGVAALNEDFSEHGILLEVLHGGELDLEYLRQFDDETLRRFTLARNGRYLLLEFPFGGWPPALETQLFDLRARGFGALLAHPERNRDVQAEPERLRPLVDAGAYIQITAASVDGRAGRGSVDAARALLKRGLVHVLASDAHHPALRAVGLRAATEAIRDERLSSYLTAEAPAAIIGGQAVPAPPPPARSCRSRRRE